MWIKTIRSLTNKPSSTKVVGIGEAKKRIEMVQKYSKFLETFQWH